MTGRSCWCLELFRKRPADGAQHRRRRVQPPRAGRAVAPEAALTHGLRCHASVPLYAGDRPLGVMNLAMRGWRRLTRQELDLLTTIADQVGVAIERARLGEQSIEHARADERSRIARDVHDTLAQGFTAVALHIEAGLSQLEPRRPRTAGAAAGARRRPQEPRRGAAIHQKPARVAAREPIARRSARRAVAPVHGRHRRARARRDVRCRCAAGRASNPKLFRIASEALTNVRKHAGARDAVTPARDACAAGCG